MSLGFERRLVEKILFVDLTRMTPATGNPPALNKLDGFRTYDFDDTLDEECFSIFYGPLDWNCCSDAEIHLGFFVDTAPAADKNVVWGVEYKSIAGDGTFDFTAGTTTVLDIVPLTTGTPANDQKVHVAILTVPYTGMIEGGILMVRVYRDANHGSDDFVGDARMFEMNIHYVADKEGKVV
jgi:hypothetical protein